MHVGRRARCPALRARRELQLPLRNLSKSGSGAIEPPWRTDISARRARDRDEGRTRLASCHSIAMPLMGGLMGRNEKRADRARIYLLSGGGGGIRTRGRLLTYTCFPGMRLKPLIHPSGVARYSS